MLLRAILLGFLLVPAGASRAGEPFSSDRLLEGIEARVESLRVESTRTLEPVAKADLLVRIGSPREALEVLRFADAPGPAAARSRVRAHLALAEFAEAGRVLEPLLAASLDDPAVRELGYGWWVLVDDLPRLQSESARRTEALDLAARAELAALTLEFEKSGDLYGKSLAVSRVPADSARAYHGLGVVSYRQRDFEASLAHLTRAAALSLPDPDLLLSLADTFIRLGRTADAIRAARLGVLIAPYHERGHYLLGNGYTERSYTDLFAAHPGVFADAAGRRELAAADSLLASGAAGAAGKAYTALAETNPGWADVGVRRGSLEFALGNFDEAIAHFEEALAACPGYGRAHNGMAKAIEGKRLRAEVHRPAYEAAFEALDMPEVPGIEAFVLNWRSLTPRHRKQVALAVAPWARYLPVLLASGSTYYIKPLYELLSETPGQELLRDQRIDYDSRLWDDVRGCGGYHTVTGIEDVERTIQNRYNTVLHELTHQVHSVLTDDRKRAIQELYRRTKVRDEAGEDAFLSRYAGGSVWEYFAEGANSLMSPRRDAYDTREIVRERLDAKDVPLRELVVALMERADVDSCYAVGFANRGDNRLEKGLPLEAAASYREALARSPRDETALGALVYALEVSDRPDSASALAGREAERNPASAGLAVRRAYALWVAGQGLDRAIASLEAARDGVREEERYRVDLELGRLHWTAGEAAASRNAFERVLEYQADSPEGLWGMAAALALAEDWDAAFERFEEAVRHRTGVVPLRAAYARDLLRAGRLEAAREQIAAALLLDPEDPETLALDGWALLLSGDRDAARARTARSLEIAPWCDMARIIRARIEAEEDPGRARESLSPVLARIRSQEPPRYVYRSKWGRYDLVHTLPRVERLLMEDL